MLTRDLPTDATFSTSWMQRGHKDSDVDHSARNPLVVHQLTSTANKQTKKKNTSQISDSFSNVHHACDLAGRLVSCKPFRLVFHTFWLHRTWLHGLLEIMIRTFEYNIFISFIVIWQWVGTLKVKQNEHRWSKKFAQINDSQMHCLPVQWHLS